MPARENGEDDAEKALRNAAVAPNRPFSLESAHAQHARSEREGAGFKRAHGTWQQTGRQAARQGRAGWQTPLQRCSESKHFRGGEASSAVQSIFLTAGV